MKYLRFKLEKGSSSTSGKTIEEKDC